jgi:Putative Ig domain
MAVALNNGVAVAPSAATTISFSYTSGSGSNRLLIAQSYSTVNITAARYSGVSMSLADTFGNLKLWSLIAPATGANTIAFDLASYNSGRFNVANFDGADQTTPLGSVVQNTGSSAAPTSSSVTCPANGMIYSGGRHDYSGGAATAGAGTTLAGSESSLGASKFAGYRTTTGTAAFVTPGSNTWNLQTVPISASSGGTPVSFSGTVSNQSHVQNVAGFNLALSGFFSGTLTPFTYSLQAGTLPTGLTLNTSTGAITGTPTVVETQTGIVIRATDTGTNTADTNAFQIQITAPAAGSLFRTMPGGALSGIGSGGKFFQNPLQ